MVPLIYYLVLSAVLFAIGVYGVMTKRNAVRLLMAIEIMMNAAVINLAAFSAYIPSIDGQVFALFVITIAAAEACVGLAIYILLFRVHKTIDLKEISKLRW